MTTCPVYDSRPIVARAAVGSLLTFPLTRSAILNFELPFRPTDSECYARRANAPECSSVGTPGGIMRDSAITCGIFTRASWLSPAANPVAAAHVSSPICLR